MKQVYLPRCGHTLCMSVAYLGLLLLSACSSNSGPQIHFIQDGDQQFRVETADYSLALDAEGVMISDASSSGWKLSFSDAQASTLLERMQAEEVLYRGLYEGTDLRVYHKGNARAAYDFLLAPGASVQSIRLSLEGNADAFINREGELVLPTENGEIRHSQPFAYQEVNGEQVEVESHFLLADGQLGFEVGEYDPSLALTIDPEIYTIKKVVEVWESGTAMMAMMAPDCPPVPVTNPYIGGSVYEDFAQNGVLDAGIDQPLSGITVTAYASDGTNVGSATTTVDGDYLITSASIVPGQSYRVEFTNFPTNYEPTFAGGDNGTSVQFVSANSCNVDLGLIDPRIYSEPNPTAVTSCFIEFAQTAGDVLISWDYNATPQASEGNDNAVLINHESDASQIGTTYGLAYHKKSGKMFAASFMKRFSGFQSGGAGGI